MFFSVFQAVRLFPQLPDKYCNLLDVFFPLARCGSQTLFTDLFS